MREGTLSCSLRGIRPEVELEWQEFGEAMMIEFTNQQTKVANEGETFDIFVTTEYKTKSNLNDNRITVKCVATGRDAHLFMPTLSIKLDLLFNQGNFSVQPLRSKVKHCTISNHHRGNPRGLHSTKPFR